MSVEEWARKRGGRLFCTPMSEIVEHPMTLSLVKDLIPFGPVENYEAYGPDIENNPNNIIIILNPVVIKGYSGEPCIRVEYSMFYFMSYDNRYCWYQSGYTLKFIKIK